MSNQEFETKRTALANAFAAAGADWLGYMGMTDTAFAEIPDTSPKKYAVAGTLKGILSMAGKMMGEDGDVERLLAAAAVGEGVPDLHNAIKAAFIAGFKESGEGWNYEMLCDPESDPHFVARMGDYLAATTSTEIGAQNAEAIRNQATDDVREAIAQAYGYLWHVNANMEAPPGVALFSLTPEQAAYKARRHLRDLLTHEQRGKGINSVRAALQTGSANTQEGDAA
jgi:hypothetical protein